METSKAISILERQRGAIEHLKRMRSSSSDFKKWRRDTEVAIQRIFGDDSRHYKDFSNIPYSLMAFSSDTPDSAFHDAYLRGLDTAGAVLSSMIDEIHEYGTDEYSFSTNPIILLEQICLRFHLIARQLRSRHAGRSTIDIEDEYDVQDLLHALLRLHFDDIRPEEWVPSYAGGSSRADFLLKQEQIIIEVKKTRPTLSEADIGAQLAVDIARYKAHPDCGCLVCFIYDPEGRIGNPTGLERDLENIDSSMKIRVIVGPKGI